MQKLLVPTDFSKTANNATDYALAIASKFNSEIHMVNAFKLPVIDPMTPPSIIESMYEENYEQAREQFHAFAQDLPDRNNQYDGHRFNIIGHLELGFAADIIASLTYKLKPDMVIMGTTGSSGINKVIGSNTANILHKIEYPLLIVPDSASYKGFHNIVFATDFKELDELVIENLLDLAAKFDASIHCIHISQGINRIEEEALSTLEDSFIASIEEEKLSFKLIKSDSFQSGIDSYCNEIEADLLVMLTKERKSWIKRLFGSSETRKMAYHSNLPLLVYHQ